MNLSELNSYLCTSRDKVFKIKKKNKNLDIKIDIQLSY